MEFQTRYPGRAQLLTIITMAVPMMAFNKSNSPCSLELDGHFRCHCSTDHSLVLGSNAAVVPANTTVLSVRNCRYVELLKGVVFGLQDLNVLLFDNIERLKFGKDIFDVEELRLRNIGRVEGSLMAKLADTKSMDTFQLLNVSFVRLGGTGEAGFQVRKLQFEYLRVETVLTGALCLTSPIDGQIFIANSYFGDLMSGGMRISGGADVRFQDSRFGHIFSHGIEVSTNSFEFLRQNVSLLDSNALVVSAQHVNISGNSFLSSFADAALSSVSIRQSYVFLSNTIEPEPGTDSLLVRLPPVSAAVRLAVGDNKLTCRCVSQGWIMSNQRLWFGGLDKSTCIHVEYVPDKVHCRVNASQFFNREKCHDQFVCN